jgi:hypothetical protein
LKKRRASSATSYNQAAWVHGIRLFYKPYEVCTRRSTGSPLYV